MSLDALDIANRPLAEQLATLTEERDSLEDDRAPEPVDALSRDELAARWDDPETDLAERRSMLMQALMRTRPAIDPAREKRGRKGFDTSRIRWVDVAEIERGKAANKAAQKATAAAGARAAR